MKHLIWRALVTSGILPRRLAMRGDSFILMFHEVGVGQMPANSFRGLLLALKDVFQFRTIDAIHRPAADPPAPGIHLTFDDGLKSQFDFAYPILRELGIPATFYVCPDLIDAGSWVWTYEIRQRVETMNPDTRIELARALFCASTGTDAIMAKIRALPLQARVDMHAEVRRATASFRPTSEQSRKFDLMSWNEIRELDPQLITIGSHTMGHAMVNTLTPEQAEYEIVESRRVLEQKLDREVSHFCYPNGLSGPTAERFVRQAYKTATTTEGCSVPTQAIDSHRLPRISAIENADRMLWRLSRATEADFRCSSLRR